MPSKKARTWRKSRKDRQGEGAVVPWCCPLPAEKLRDSIQSIQSNHLGATRSPARARNTATCKSAPRAVVPRKSRRPAFVTLLMRGDGYLPGVALLGWRLSRLAPGVERVCMVTHDVPAATRRLLLETELYMRVVEVPYISTKKTYMSDHADTKRREAYRQSFTKLNCIGLVEYDVIAFFDADLIPVSPAVASLVADPGLAPAAVYVGCFHPTRSALHLRRYRADVCPHESTGEPLPWDFQTSMRQRCKEHRWDYIGFESSIFVAKPSRTKLNQLLGMIDSLEAQGRYYLLKGDTQFLSYALAPEMKALDMRFLMRGAEIADLRDAFVIDPYNIPVKPWDIVSQPRHVSELARHPDAVAWWRAYMDMAASTGLTDREPRLAALRNVIARALARVQTGKNTRD